MKKITILLLSLLLIASCGTADNNKQDTVWDKTNSEKQVSVKDTNESEEDKLEKELMSDEDFKMHFVSIDDDQEVEAIMQKNGENMSVEIVKMTGGQEEMPMDMSMKQMLLKDNFFYTNMKVWEKDFWLKWEYNPEKEEQAGFIDIKKLLKKIKQENVPKEVKEIDGDTYDCYSWEFLEDTTMCFAGKNLKYIMENEGGHTMKIIEFSDTVDTKAFETPADDEIITQQDFMKMVMESVQWEQ